ncbi:unnamed protein product [marine sediment metagenome]|uniref:Uncharacterized protein n=1 Tax=marine sediment metagenome TaxID=412755 RepID=X1JT84_9ZZZZ
MHGDKVVAYRHGDLLITKIKEVEKNRYGVKKLDHLILAFGENTQPNQGDSQYEPNEPNYQ